MDFRAFLESRGCSQFRVRYAAPGMIARTKKGFRYNLSLAYTTASGERVCRVYRLREDRKDWTPEDHAAHAFRLAAERIAKAECPCSRCGGAGGWAGWPGWACYDCGGTGVDPSFSHYDAEAAGVGTVEQ